MSQAGTQRLRLCSCGEPWNDHDEQYESSVGIGSELHQACLLGSCAHFVGMVWHATRQKQDLITQRHCLEDLRAPVAMLRATGYPCQTRFKYSQVPSQVSCEQPVLLLWPLGCLPQLPTFSACTTLPPMPYTPAALVDEAHDVTKTEAKVEALGVAQALSEAVGEEAAQVAQEELHLALATRSEGQQLLSWPYPTEMTPKPTAYFSSLLPNEHECLLDNL